MHGLVAIDKYGKSLFNSIIWCDSRSVLIGEEASNKLDKNIISSSLLNSPGNFTASKLRWVKENKPDVYSSIYKFMLPGDFIVFKLISFFTFELTSIDSINRKYINNTFRFVRRYNVGF